MSPSELMSEDFQFRALMENRTRGVRPGHG